MAGLAIAIFCLILGASTSQVCDPEQAPSCGDPGTPEGGSQIQETVNTPYGEGEVVTFTCPHSYLTPQPASVICVGNGTYPYWVDGVTQQLISQPQCVDVTAPTCGYSNHTLHVPISTRVGSPLTIPQTFQDNSGFYNISLAGGDFSFGESIEVNGEIAWTLEDASGLTQLCLVDITVFEPVASHENCNVSETPIITECNSTVLEVTFEMLSGVVYDVTPLPTLNAASVIVIPQFIQLSCESLYTKVTVTQTAIHSDGVTTDECIYELKILPSGCDPTLAVACFSSGSSSCDMTQCNLTCPLGSFFLNTFGAVNTLTCVDGVFSDNFGMNIHESYPAVCTPIVFAADVTLNYTLAMGTNDTNVTQLGFVLAQSLQENCRLNLMTMEIDVTSDVSIIANDDLTVIAPIIITANSLGALEECYGLLQVQIPACDTSFLFDNISDTSIGEAHYVLSQCGISQNCSRANNVFEENFVEVAFLCFACQTGNNGSQAECTECQRGSYGTSGSCTDCPVGQTTLFNAATSQNQCVSNCTSPLVENGTSCITIPPDTYYNAGVAFPCTSGETVGARRGEDPACIDVCPAGHYSPTGIGPMCTPCPIGYYQDEPAQTCCIPCDNGTTLSVGALSPSACVNATNNTDCQSLSCVEPGSNGTCDDSGAPQISYCICNPGYYGVHCSQQLNPCASLPCLNGGFCELNSSSSTGYICSNCPNGTDSDNNCEDNVNECASSPCGVGECQDTVNGYICHCEPAPVPVVNSVTLDGPIIIDTENVTLTTGQIERVHRFGFACLINASLTPAVTNITVTFEITRFPYISSSSYAYARITSITKTVLVSDLVAYLVEDEFRAFFGNYIWCRTNQVVGDTTSPLLYSDYYFAGYELNYGSGWQRPWYWFPYWWVYMRVCDDTTPITISVRPTVPIHCWHYTREAGSESCVYRVRLADNEQVDHQCPTSLPDHTAAASFDVVPVHVPGRTSYYIPLTFEPFPHAAGCSFLDGYIIPHIWLYVYRDCYDKHCYSYTDPHLNTFDNHWYRLFVTGDFALVQSPVIEIHARTKSCWQVSCNCGVIAREGNQIVGVDACSGVANVVQYLSDPSGPAPVITGSSYYHTIVMPSGVIIRAYFSPSRGHMNIYISLPNHVRVAGNITGLCGNANSDRYDDTIPAGGTVAVTGDQPEAFYESYRLSSTESFFYSSGRTCREPATYLREAQPGSRNCGCAADGSGAQCNVIPPTVLRTTGATCDSVIVGRRKRQADSPTPDTFITEEELNYDVEPLNSDGPVNIDSIYSGIGRTEAEVRAACQDTIESSPLYTSCNVSVDELVDTCVIDTGVSDSDDFINGLNTLFERTCLNAIAASTITTSYDASSTIDPVTGQLMVSPVFVLSTLICDPGSCNGQGTCDNGTCICNPGFAEYDCSIDLSQPIVLDEIQYDGNCDAQEYACTSPYVSGSNIPSTNISCLVQFSLDGIDTTVTTNATVLLGSTRTCELPLTLQEYGSNILVYSISLVWNHTGEQSNVLQLRVYDSTCLNCTGTTDCLIKNTTCNINDTCYLAGDVSPSLYCFECDPESDNDAWTPVFDTPISQTPVDLYKYPGENITYQLTAAGSSGRNVSYTLWGTYPVTVSLSGLLTWPSTDTNSYDNLKVHVLEHPCGFNATISVSLTVQVCPCENGGNCTSTSPPTGSLFSCTCPEGFNGTLCQNNINDECASSPCLNGGTCTDQVDAFTCSCLPKYNGTFCEMELDEWSEWSELSACDAQTCVRSRDRTCVIPPCDGVSSQLECCTGCTGDGGDSDQSDGIVITFSPTDINGALMNAEAGFQAIADTVNEYCTSNIRTCCSLLGIPSVGTPVTEFMMTSADSVRIAPGYSNCNNSVRILVSGLRNNAERACRNGSADTPNSDEDYLNTDFVLSLFATEEDAIELAFGQPIQSVEAPSLTAVSSSDLQTLLVAALIPSLLFIIIIIIVIILVRRYRANKGAVLGSGSRRFPYGRWRARGSRYRDGDDKVGSYDFYSSPWRNTQRSDFY